MSLWVLERGGVCTLGSPVPTTCEKGIRYDVTRFSGAAGTPWYSLFCVHFYIWINHCMGTYDGNSRTTMVAVDPFGESERNSRTPWWPLLPGNKHEGLYQRKHSHLRGGRLPSSIAPPSPPSNVTNVTIFRKINLAIAAHHISCDGIELISTPFP